MGGERLGPDIAGWRVKGWRLGLNPQIGESVKCSPPKLLGPSGERLTVAQAVEGVDPRDQLDKLLRPKVLSKIAEQGWLGETYEETYE